MDEDSMITTANGTRYLRPDYMQPLNATLDAKKSPLALLAQTCSQIGADPPPKPSLDKPAHIKKEEKQPREKSSPSGSSTGSGSPKSCFRPYEDEPTTKRVKTPAKKATAAGSPCPSPKEKPAFHPYLAPYLAAAAAARGKDVCRDPYCLGCQAKQQPPCPPGCTQCKEGGSHHAAYLALAQPYLCSWIGPDASFCGKRFSTSDDLLTHLRAHTSDPLLHPLLRAYTPPLSPLRYHPYSKPPIPPYPLPPTLHPSLPPYYPPYALYPRLGTSHP